ncbi:hypothetical protein [Streptomyces sp. NPDC091416]|uniref:hypothetical protein n=1 Tax=Streptomyces sp. NPDC091416 TaxID=3366003 RepID=UPI00381648B1
MISDVGRRYMQLHNSDYYYFFRRPENLRIHLAGLHAVGKITDEEYELVTTQLIVAGMLPASQGTPM